MGEKIYLIALSGAALLFTGVFAVVVVPPLVADPNILAAILAGFVNPYAAGYSTDVILCWIVLCLWIVQEARTKSVKHGWVCLILGLVPGVAVGFALYLIIRHKQAI
ncbi:MAG: DUF2834 domain-containing protein [Pseudohongiellaceae bacterium]